MSRYLSLALCLVCAPAFAETIVYDFSSLSEMPAEISLESGELIAGTGLSNFGYSDPETFGQLNLQFGFDRPFHLDSISYTTGHERIYAGVSMPCDYQPTIDDPGLGNGPVAFEYDCLSYNGGGRFEGWGGEDEMWGDQYHFSLVSMTLSFADPVPFVAGDTDYDADVDVGDLNNTRNDFGGDPVYGYGDANRDGDIDVGDLNDVRNNFGSSLSPSLNAVPEPSTLFLLAALMSVMVAARARPIS